MEAKDNQLQQQGTQLQERIAQLREKDAQLQQQGTQLVLRGTQTDRQQRELEALRVGNDEMRMLSMSCDITCVVS